MRHEEYAKHVEEFVSEMASVTRDKNADYSSGMGDAMQNFYELAEGTHGTPLQAWMTLTLKHMTAIKRFIKDGMVSSETIHGRFIDLANYAMLGDALIKDMIKKELPMAMSSLGRPLTGKCVVCGGSGRTMVRPVGDPSEKILVTCPACHPVRDGER